jgi:hypothetical protein
MALALLFSGAADYVIFDASDPFAPMNAAGTFDLTGPTYHPNQNIRLGTIQRSKSPGRWMYLLRDGHPLRAG